MNTSFDPLDLVNTYGAFGSVGQVRYNVVFEGTDAATPDANAQWRPYPYRALPVALDKRPVQIAPYQPRLDWRGNVVRGDNGHTTGLSLTLYLVWCSFITISRAR